MKKAKRFLTGLLSAVMALSLCAMPAMAAGAGEETPGTSTGSPIWTETEGSITIHKYEWNGTNKGAATGEEDDINNLPSDNATEPATTPSPLAGAEFTIYKVQDEQWLKDYYSGEDTKIDYTKAFEVETYVTKNTDGTYTVSGAKNTYGPKATGTDGTVQFGKEKKEDGSTAAGIELGLYVVVETKTPSQVTTPCDPFLVSVPMTRVGTTKPLTDWLYDVHVYPKNKTSYGDITLIKKGQVGNGTADVVLKGVKFQLFKFTGTVDDGKIKAYNTANSSDWKEITKAGTSAGDNTGDKDFNLTTKDSGEIVVNGLISGYYCFVEQDVGNNKAFITDQTPHYFEVKGETSQEITVAEDGTVTTKEGASLVANLELTVTDPRPDVEKKVKDRVPASEKEEDQYVEASDYSVGDEIPYKVTVKVPKALLDANVKTNSDFVFEVKDTPEHLEDKDVKAISANGQEITDGVTITPDKDYNNKGGRGFTASFTQEALKELVGDGDTFTITYTATLLKDADMTNHGNPNTINLKYSNQIDADGNIKPGESTSEIEDDAVVYTFSIHVDKKAGDTNQKLPGVHFNVYKEVEKVTSTSVKGSEIGFKDDRAEKNYEKIVINADSADPYDLVTDANNDAVVSGLANGTYYLVETKTADGYNLLSGPVEVTISVSYKKTWTAKNDYVDGKLVHHEESERKEYFGGDENKAGNSFTLTTIINRKGFDLPTTGGFGTLLFSGIGVLLVVAGVGVLLSLKKKNRA